MNQVLNLARKNIAALVPYESARSLALSGKIFLDANESPDEGVGPSLNRYPEPQPRAVLERLSRLYGVSPSSLLVGRGSDEAIDLIIRAFCEPGSDEVLICPPTYGMYEISARIQGAGIAKVPMIHNSSGFALDETGIREKIISNKNLKVIFLCAPNNPTGSGLIPESMARICRMTEGKCIVVVDEAYIEFSLYPSMTRFISLFPNLVVLRTLSKAWASAGVRCGTAIAHRNLIEILQKIRSPYPLATPCVEAILRVTSEESEAKTRSRVENLRSEREFLRNKLNELKEVETVYPSDANFILVKFRDSKSIFEYLKDSGIVVRDRSKEPALSNCIRITIGDPTENRTLLRALQDYSKKAVGLLKEEPTRIAPGLKAGIGTGNISSMGASLQ
jgi:histidinol-phosphate aminotransferase